MGFKTFPVLFCCVVLCSSLATSSSERAGRMKRQNQADQVIDAVFQVPIQTLSAVGSLVKTSRPIFTMIRQQIQQGMAPRIGHHNKFTNLLTQFPAGAAGNTNTRQGRQPPPTSSFNRLANPKSGTV